MLPLPLINRLLYYLLFYYIIFVKQGEEFRMAAKFNGEFVPIYSANSAENIQDNAICGGGAGFAWLGWF
jgi:hypothetical protein